MKKLFLTSLTCFVLVMPFALPLRGFTRQAARVTHVGDFILDWQKGELDVSRTPSGKLTLVLSGTRGPVAFTFQEKGSERLKKSKLKSTRREFSGRALIATAQEAKAKTKESRFRLLGASVSREVSLVIEQVDLNDEKTTIKVRCDQAVYKAGAKPGSGRIDFSGNARVWYYGFLDTETTTESGWIDLGDPDDLENKPPTLHLGGGNTTGKVKDEPGAGAKKK